MTTDRTLTVFDHINSCCNYCQSRSSKPGLEDFQSWSYLIIIIIIYFENKFLFFHFFHATLGLDVWLFAHMRSLHISLKTAHSGCKPSTLISSSTHSYQVFLFLPLHLPEEFAVHGLKYCQHANIILPNYFNDGNFATVSVECWWPTEVAGEQLANGRSLYGECDHVESVQPISADHRPVRSGNRIHHELLQGQENYKNQVGTKLNRLICSHWCLEGVLNTVSPVDSK